ncbi:hypothetical protein ACMSDU_22465 [Bacteroides thetaiotaomicron]|uniref:hypothetical protein n=1 Tax=Bacteroides thetaiotaomicron TaxID=818 RepID=UPI0039C1ECC4
MKKLFTLFALILVSIAATAQIKQQEKSETIGSYRMGIIKLTENNGQYAIKGQTKQFVDTRLVVDLGNEEQAIAILQSMIDYKGGNGKSVDLNNPSMNVARYLGSMMGGWEIGITDMYATSIVVSKGEMKKMIKTIKDR